MCHQFFETLLGSVQYSFNQPKVSVHTDEISSTSLSLSRSKNESDDCSNAIEGRESDMGSRRPKGGQQYYWTRYSSG